MPKNANGEGSIYKRMKDGKLIRFDGAISYIGDDGNSKRHTVYGRTRADVRDKLGTARERLDAGAPVRDATRTVADWLAQWRATTLAASDRKPATREMYAHLSRKHLEPAPFGAITLDRLRPNDIEALILKCRDRGLSDSSVRSVYTVARLALDGAVRDGLLARNPAAVVKRPGVARREAKHAAAVDVTALLTAADGLRYRDALVLIAATGMRRGEALALRWTDIDLDAGLVAVRGTLGRVGGKLVVSEPKTDRSRRTVPLGAPLVAMLRARRRQQAAEQLRAANQWPNSGLVFTTELGTLVEPRNILRTVETAAAKAGMEGVVVHTLRHSAAVAWLAAGVHIKAVADLLGHASIAVTGDVYGHTSDDTARAAVEGLSGALGL
jgi:integrase